MIEWIQDRWLTWRTGLTRDQREYRQWVDTTVNIRASTAEDMFKNFKYVIMVDYWKLFDHSHPFGLPLVDHARQYFWPARPPGDCAVYRLIRGEQEPSGKFYITDLGSEDRVYVATNNGKDAVMIAMKYA